MALRDEDTLCRELVPRVRAFALRRTRDAALAADVAQDVTMIVIEALREGRVEDPSRLAAFALGVARNVVVAAQRGERRRSALLEQFAPTLAEVATIEEHGVDRAKLEGCMNKLPPRARTILSLTFFADRSADEIARELASEAGAVRVARHRALAALRECMGGRS